MKPFSAFYYIKENRLRSSIIIFMMILTTFHLLIGNYVDSIYYYWDKAREYSEKLVVVGAVATDENFEDFDSLRNDLKEDENLIVCERSSYGLPGLNWDCTFGIEMGSSSFVFSTPEDLKQAFESFGIDADLSAVKNNSVVISKNLARQYDFKKGDVIDSKTNKYIRGSYTIDALIDDESYIVFYVTGENETGYRLNVLSRDNKLSGAELRDYIRDIQGDRKANIEPSVGEDMKWMLGPFENIFLLGTLLLSVVLSVIVNSVITGQFIRRTYEFGVYRAIGISRFGIYKKCAAEILTMDMIAILIGGALVEIATFILNEIKYIPEGKYLPYFSSMGIKGFLISNILVVIPTIILKGRAMSRADVTEF